MRCVTLIRNFATDRQESILRFGRLLHSELTQRLGSDRILSLEATPVATRFIPKGKLASYFDRLVLFNLRLIFTPAGLYHVLAQPEYLTGLIGKKKLITCHDLIPLLQQKEKLMGGLAENSYASSLLRWQAAAYRSADHVVCVSESTRADLIRLTGVDPARTSVIYNGHLRDLKPVPADQANARIVTCCPSLINAPFIMHLGSNATYKNRRGVIEVFNRLAGKHSDLMLAMCGQGLTERERATQDASPFRSRIHHVLEPDDELVDALYSRARLLLFPSLYEGFGWPIIEAMACGCPAVGSNRGSLKEVVCDSGLSPDPQQHDQITAICDRLLVDSPYREFIIAKGFEHSRKFTAERMVKQYMDVYQMLGLKI